MSCLVMRGVFHNKRLSHSQTRMGQGSLLFMKDICTLAWNNLFMSNCQFSTKSAKNSSCEVFLLLLFFYNKKLNVFVLYKVTKLRQTTWIILQHYNSELFVTGFKLEYKHSSLLPVSPADSAAAETSTSLFCLTDRLRHGSYMWGSWQMRSQSQLQ